MPEPIDTVNQLTAALNRGDVDAALSLYEGNAVLVAQPFQLARGAAELRAALGQFVGLKPRLTSQAESIIETADVAHTWVAGLSRARIRPGEKSRWVANPPTSSGGRLTGAG